MRNIKVLFVGESWIIVTTHIKGVDQFTQSYYDEGVKWIRAALEAKGIEFVHMPCHDALWRFPSTAEELSHYDAVIFSDIGYSTIMLHPDTTARCQRTPDRLSALEQYVRNGGAFLMIGGYMSFSGIEGKAHYKGSVVEEMLPVELLEGDDRRETPQGVYPAVMAQSHEILRNIDEAFPFFLSYNRLIPKAQAQVVLSFEKDPLLVVWDYGKGRTAAFAADTAPHGAPPEFLDWKYFGTFWDNTVRWLCKK